LIRQTLQITEEKFVNKYQTIYYEKLHFVMVRFLPHPALRIHNLRSCHTARQVIHTLTELYV